jgi:hypothetical protein
VIDSVDEDKSDCGCEKAEVESKAAQTGIME